MLCNQNRCGSDENLSGKKNWINNFFFCLKFKIKVNFFTYIHPLKIKGITQSDSEENVERPSNKCETSAHKNERQKKIRVHEMQWSKIADDRQRRNWYMLRFVMKVLTEEEYTPRSVQNGNEKNENEKEKERKWNVEQVHDEDNDDREYTQSMSVHCVQLQIQFCCAHQSKNSTSIKL